MVNCVLLAIAANVCCVLVEVRCVLSPVRCVLSLVRCVLFLCLCAVCCVMFGRLVLIVLFAVQ